MRRSSTWLSATDRLLLCAPMTAPGFRDRSLPMRQARTRPSSRAVQETASARYLGPPKVPPRCNRALSRPPARAEALGYRDDLRPVRSFVASKAKCAGLTPPRIPDLVLAISELAGNTLRHTDGGGTVQVWRTREEIICQVADTGQITDPLARHRPPSDELLGGNGLWLVNQVCDLVQARTGPAGTTTRLHMRLRRPSGRRAGVPDGTMVSGRLVEDGCPAIIAQRAARPVARRGIAANLHGVRAAIWRQSAGWVYLRI